MNKQRMVRRLTRVAYLLGLCGIAAAHGTTPGASHQGSAEDLCFTIPSGLPEGIHSPQRFHFDADQYRPQVAAKPEIAAHAKYLASHPDMRVQIIGHTDARGSREYDLALALKRAEAVRAMLLEGGAADAQVTVISCGAEHSRVKGHNATSPEESRRVDLYYSFAK
ncbi:OmpA family protein [Ralstonia soli]|uniref:OmpA family protein n=1 Tax=Ralstonia soli TaxID=2953896 RepID=A0ABT1AT01_9RALS|nr:OmpA family protein [Ralstonia soli]MCO5401590.1 OmpA family protein [Ralstonia soli]